MSTLGDSWGSRNSQFEAVSRIRFFNRSTRTWIRRASVGRTMFLSSQSSTIRSAGFGKFPVPAGAWSKDVQQRRRHCRKPFSRAPPWLPRANVISLIRARDSPQATHRPGRRQSRSFQFQAQHAGMIVPIMSDDRPLFGRRVIGHGLRSRERCRKAPRTPYD
jgi:hypothetical protein